MDFQNEKGEVLPEWLYHVMEDIDDESVCFLRKNDKEYQAIRTNEENE